MRTAQQQIDEQIAQGNKTITMIYATKQGANGKKITIEDDRFVDITLSEKSVRDFVIKTWHKGSTMHYYSDERNAETEQGQKVLDAIEERTKQIEAIEGSVLITTSGYWENCRLQDVKITIEAKK